MTTKSPAKRNTSGPPATRQAAQTIVGRLADRYGVDPGKLLDTLRDTVFKPPKNDNRPLSDVELAAGLTLCDRYGLDPFSRQIYVTRAKGALLVIVPVDGWSAIVNRQETYDGCEFEEIWKDDGTIHAVKCTMWDRRRGHPVSVTEYYDECFQQSDRNDAPWNSHPIRMTRHKAYIQCARVCYGLPGLVDADEAARFVEVQDAVVSDAGPATPGKQAKLIAPSRNAAPTAPPAKEDSPEEKQFRKLLGEWRSVKGNLEEPEIEEVYRQAKVDPDGPMSAKTLDALLSAGYTALDARKEAEGS